MDKSEAQKILREHLAKFRAWSYAQLAERVERDRQAHECLEYVEGTSPGGAQYQMDFQALWARKPHGNILVCGSISPEPQKRFLGFLLVYRAVASASFVMRPDERIV